MLPRILCDDIENMSRLMSRARNDVSIDLFVLLDFRLHFSNRKNRFAGVVNKYRKYILCFLVKEIVRNF